MRPLHGALSCCCGHLFSTGLTGTGIQGHCGQGGSSQSGWPWHRGIEICYHWPLAPTLGLCLEVTFPQPGSFVRKAKSCQGLGLVHRPHWCHGVSCCPVAGPPYTECPCPVQHVWQKSSPADPRKEFESQSPWDTKAAAPPAPHCHPGTRASKPSQRSLLSNRQWHLPLREEAPQTTTRKPAKPPSGCLICLSVFLSLPLCLCVSVGILKE